MQWIYKVSLKSLLTRNKCQLFTHACSFFIDCFSHRPCNNWKPQKKFKSARVIYHTTKIRLLYRTNYVQKTPWCQKKKSERLKKKKKHRSHSRRISFEFWWCACETLKSVTQFEHPWRCVRYRLHPPLFLFTLVPSSYDRTHAFNFFLTLYLPSPSFTRIPVCILSFQCNEAAHRRPVVVATPLAVFTLVCVNKEGWDEYTRHYDEDLTRAKNAQSQFLFIFFLTPL